MPVIGINTTISLATKEARTILTKFDKSLSTGSTTNKEIVLASNTSGTLSLSQSDYLIIIGPSDILKVRLSNLEGEVQTLENVGFLMVSASNLNQVTIENTSNEEKTISIMF